MEVAFEYIKNNGGQDTEESYPYEGKDGKCRYKESNIGAKDIGYKTIQPGDENALKSAIATQVEKMKYCWISGSDTLNSSRDPAVWG